MSQEFNLCLFSCTSKAFLVLLFKASRHSHNPGCCWGSAHGDPVGWAFQPFNQRLAQIHSKREPHSVGSLLQLSPSGGFCGFLQRSSKEPAPFSHPPLVGPQQQALPPQRSREIPQHPGCSQRATPHAPTLLGANGSLRGAEKEMTYYCLLFYSANREAFIADGTQGNVAQNGEKENAAGKITSIR